MKIEILKEKGLPVAYAVFNRPVKSASGSPETAFFSERKQTAVVSRLAEIWLTDQGFLLCQQGAVYTIVPMANVLYAPLK